MATTHTGSPASGQGAQDNSGMIGRVRDRATAELSTQKDKAIDGIGSVTQAVRQSTQQLRDQQHDTLAGYVERAADQIDRLSQQLRNKDVGELFEDAQRLARRQPAAFIGGAFALGLIGARFLKSSSRHDSDDFDDESWPGRGEYASGGWREGTSTGTRDYTSGRAGYTAADTGYTGSSGSTGFTSGTGATGGFTGGTSGSSSLTGGTPGTSDLSSGGGTSAASTGRDAVSSTGGTTSGSTGSASTAAGRTGSGTSSTTGTSRSRKSPDTERS